MESRVQSELRNIQDNPIYGISVGLVDGNIREWNALVKGLVNKLLIKEWYSI